MLAMTAPLLSLICLIVGMAHQIKVILEKGNSDELSLPRIILAVVSGIVWIFYGLEINNQWMVVLNIAGIFMNAVLILVIWHLRKNHQSLQSRLFYFANSQFSVIEFNHYLDISIREANAGMADGIFKERSAILFCGRHFISFL